MGANIRVRVELVNLVKRKNEKDSGDPVETGRKESKLTFKNLNLGNWEDDFWPK